VKNNQRFNREITQDIPTQKPLRPVRFIYGSPQPEKPWPVWYFLAYIAFLPILWLVAYPIIDTLYDNMIAPLNLVGYMDFFFKSLPFILFLGLTWIAFRKTFRREGE